MRIALDCRCVRDVMGGIGTYAWSLMRELRLLNTQHDIVCYVARVPMPAPIPLGPRYLVRAFDAGMCDPRFEQFILPDVLAEDGIDVYHNATFAVPTVRRGTRLISTVHDVVFAKQPELVSEAWLRAYLDTATRQAARGATRIIAVSEASKKDIVGCYGVAAERIETIYNGADGDAAAPEPGALEAMGLENKRYVLYVGSLEPKKNVGLLIEAFESLLKEGRSPGLKLALVGSGQVPQRVNAQDLAPHVLVPGFVSTSRLEALYRGAAAFVYPSLFEGFGLPPLEAMNHGVPTVVSDSTSLPEIVGDGARVVPTDRPEFLKDVLADILTSSDVAKDLSDRGRRQAAKFRWRECALAHLRLYEAVAAERRST